MSGFRDLPIALKLNIVIVGAITGVMLVSGVFLGGWLKARLEEKSLSELQRVNQQVVDMVDAYSQVLERSAQMLGTQFADPLPRDISNDQPQANQAVESFTRSTGAVATIFARQGDSFVRIATTVRNDKGERVVGTSLATTHPAFPLVTAGKTYTGPASLFGQEYMTYYAPLLDASGQVQAIAFIGINFTEGLEALKKRVLGIKVGETGYVFALDAKKVPGRAVIHPTSEGKDLIDLADSSGHKFIKKMIDQKQGVVRYAWADPQSANDEARDKIAVLNHFAKWDWVIGSGSYVDEFTRDTRNILIGQAVAALIMIVALFVAVVFSTRLWVSRPLNQALTLSQRVAEGDLTVAVAASSNDEVGQLLQSTDRMCKQLRGIITEVNAGIMTLANGAGNLVATSNQVADTSGKQSAAASSMAAAVEQMSTSIDMVAHHAQQAREMAETSGRTSEAGAAVINAAITEMTRIADTVRSASQAVAQLGEQSQQIANIVHVISEIADQTNLLALNAAIEAARAGEHGRGFAVVADEVRKLAERTTQSTHEIESMVTQIQSGASTAVGSMDVGVQQVEAGASLASEAGESINQIRTSAAKVDLAVISISEALGEQTSASQHIARNVEQIALQAEGNHAQALSTSSAAIDLENLSASLRQSISRFRI